MPLLKLKPTSWRARSDSFQTLRDLTKCKLSSYPRLQPVGHGRCTIVNDFKVSSLNYLRLLHLSFTAPVTRCHALHSVLLGAFSFLQGVFSFLQGVFSFLQGVFSFLQGVFSFLQEVFSFPEGVFSFPKGGF